MALPSLSFFGGSRQVGWGVCAKMADFLRKQTTCQARVFVYNAQESSIG
jgi:hypothetical protein